MARRRRYSIEQADEDAPELPEATVDDRSAGPTPQEPPVDDEVEREALVEEGRSSIERADSEEPGGPDSL